jgi:succinoglycan biosynthesis transport protein ExoP
MLSRAPALPHGSNAPHLLDALKRSASPVVLFSILVAVAAYAAVSMIVPERHAEVELAAIGGMAAFLVGIAAVIATAVLRGPPKAKPAKKADGTSPRSEPSLAPVRREPLVRDMTDAEVARSTQATASDVVASTGSATPLITFTDVDLLAARLKERRPSGGGHRTLITSDVQPLVPYAETIELAKSLASSGAQTILIDWSPSGEGFASMAGLEQSLGWNDLLNGAARFDEIIQRLRGTHAQAIASGKQMRPDSRIDVGLLNLTLDALDEVYDHIVVTARNAEARALFEAIEGRFDAGITIVPPGDYSAAQGAANAFLGFEVADIDVIRLVRSEPAASQMADRIARATRARTADEIPA